MAVEVSTVKYLAACSIGLFLIVPWLTALFGLTGDVPGPNASLWNFAGIGKIVSQTLMVGLSSTVLSTLLASAILYAEQRQPSRLWRLTFTAPHLAFAVACMWLFTPYGWFDRLIPISWTWFEQQSLLSLVVLLVIKETPFLVVLGQQQLKQLAWKNWLLQARSLGASQWQGWWLVVFPAWLKAMRLLLVAVAVYSVGVVDMALIAGPLNPPLLGPQLVSWQQQFEVRDVLLAEQGVWLLISLTLCLVVWIYLQESLLHHFCRWRLARWRSLSKDRTQLFLTIMACLRWLVFLVSIASGLALLAMGMGRGWFYPALTPEYWSWSEFLGVAQLLLPAVNATLGLALLSAFFVTLLLVWTREWQRRHSRDLSDILFIAALFIPQTALVLAWLHTLSDATLVVGEWLAWAVTFYAHTWFAYAYAYLSYAPAERNVTQNHLIIGRSMGYSYWRSWWHFKRPELSAALTYAFLVSFLVSIAQYVPTVLLGQGYLSTLTTELVVLSSGAELQAPAVAATLLWLMALTAIVMVGWWQRRLKRDRRNE